MSEGSVFLLWHVREPDGNEEELLIGAYCTEADAMSAIERLRSKGGFADAPEGFRINRYELNRDHWEQGYDVVKEIR
jgi:homoserine kinase type II